MNTKQTLCQRRAQSGYWLPLVITSILLSFSNSTVAAQEALPPKTNNDSADVSEPIKSQITSLEEEIEKLKQFNELVNQYNQLIKDRRFAEAELVGKKARELQTNEPQAIIMIEKAKMYRQLAFNESVRKRKKGIAEDISAPMGSVIDDEQLKIFKLQNGNVKDVARIIESIYGGPSFALEFNEQTNSLIMHCDESELEEIETVIQRLDSRPGSIPEPFTDSYPIDVVEQPITSIAEYRRQLDALEQPVLQLAEQVRAAEAKQGKDHPDSAKLRADLRAAVQQTFAARQEIQRAELAEFTRGLQRMQQSIDARDRIADKIIDRRLEELLDPNVAWTQLSTPLVQSESTSPNSTSSANGYLCILVQKNRSFQPTKEENCVTCFCRCRAYGSAVRILGSKTTAQSEMKDAIQARMGRHNLCRGRETPVMLQSDRKARRADTATTNS